MHHLCLYTVKEQFIQPTHLHLLITVGQIFHQIKRWKRKNFTSLGVRIHNRWPQVVETARPSSSLQQALHFIINLQKYPLIPWNAREIIDPVMKIIHRWVVNCHRLSCFLCSVLKDPKSICAKRNFAQVIWLLLADHFYTIAWQRNRLPFDKVKGISRHW